MEGINFHKILKIKHEIPKTALMIAGKNHNYENTEPSHTDIYVIILLSNTFSTRHNYPYQHDKVDYLEFNLIFILIVHLIITTNELPVSTEPTTASQLGHLPWLSHSESIRQPSFSSTKRNEIQLNPTDILNRRFALAGLDAPINGNGGDTVGVRAISSRVVFAIGPEPMNFQEKAGGILLAESGGRPQLPLLSSHSLIRYGESVLTERALITTLDRSSDPLRVRAPSRAPLDVCARVLRTSSTRWIKHRPRRMRIDSVAQTITFTSLAFFLSSSLTTVSGAPAYGHRTAVSNTNNMHRWLQPCGNQVPMNFKRMPQRHSVHRTLKRVRTQLRVAQNHFRKNLKDVHEIYSKVYKVLKGQYRMPWLPEKEFEWYFREVWCLEKGKKADRALPHLHDSLQRFAITFHHLKAFRLKSNINVDDLTMNTRNDIIKETGNEIYKVLCEVETAILNLGLQLPTAHTEKIVTESSNWAKEGDLTLMLIQDWGVIKLYQTFLNAWTKAFRNATAPGPGTCDSNRQAPGAKNIHKGSGPKGKRIPKAKKQNRPMRKHPVAAGQNSSLSQGPKRGIPRNRLSRNKQRKLVEI
ncbi:uncharacterized protein LOC143186251 [Calliopsis andreniformis]|uniref:uncharacterized protein LOC143186251 n=1 Tax=Calliopsis andreniformis TaxID=337506 RepID=UPI003FCEDB17